MASIPWFYLVWVHLDNPTEKGREALQQALQDKFKLSKLGGDVTLDQIDESSAKVVAEGLGNTQLGISAPLDDKTERIHKALEKMIEATKLVSGEVTVSMAFD